MSELIPFGRPLLGEEERNAVMEVSGRAHSGPWSPRCQNLNRRLRTFTDCPPRHQRVLLHGGDALDLLCL
jgi:dTDP-4-amino-4,6-dideoxygalactose transaminase